MKFAVIALILSFSTIVGAQTLDQKLDQYIEKFNLKPLQGPGARNQNLVRLGHTLFTSRLLSGNKNISCVECHHPALMTHDNLPLALGEGADGFQTGKSNRRQGKGQVIPRNTPALFNLHTLDTLFWDGRVSFDPLSKRFQTPVPLREDVASTLKSALAAQAIFPIANHEEMLGAKGSNPIADAASETEAWDLIVTRLLEDENIRDQFEAIFPGQKINIGHVGEALAEFQRQTFYFADTPYDNYLRGNKTALTEIQKLGMEIFFNKGKCGECHSGENLTNSEFHNVGVPQIGPGKENGDDFGRYQWDRKPENLYAFKVPPLRNVALTAPYFHDGAFKTLAQVVEHYDLVAESLLSYKLVNNWKSYTEALKDHDHATDELRIANLSTKLTHPLNFQEEEEKALTEFLTTALTDKRFLNREIDGDYRTYMRLQLKKSGFEKLAQTFDGIKRKDTYYYFDLIAEGSFALRGLTKPIRLIAIDSDEGTQLVFREEAYKTATSSNGVVLSGNFYFAEIKDLPRGSFDELRRSYDDMFSRMYTYHNDSTDAPIPQVELDVIKRDVEVINSEFHRIDFDGLATISDQMNLSKDELFFVPTSVNTKEVVLFRKLIAGRMIDGNLQKSYIRNEKGAIVVTYALELETEKVSKAEYQAFTMKVLEELKLESQDVGGGSPSPSDFTLEVLNKVL